MAVPDLLEKVSACRSIQSRSCYEKVVSCSLVGPILWLTVRRYFCRDSDSRVHSGRENEDGQEDPQEKND
jgi:hypothetical protein